MLRLISIAAILTLASGTLAAPVPKEVKRNSDAERMQGVWKEASGTRWFFDAKKLFAGGQNTTDRKGIEYDLALRPEAKPPEFDLIVNGNVQFSGIYQFVEDELQIAYHSGAQRPADFEKVQGKHIHNLKPTFEVKK